MIYLFGNWKMYCSVAESQILAAALANQPAAPGSLALAVFPNTLVYQQVAQTVTKTGIALGAQDTAWVSQGAYTGATSAHAFAEAGATYALVGHSERRHIFGESNEDVRKKLEAILDAGLVPVLCIGETKEDVENGKEEYRLKKQIQKAFDGLELAGKKILVAYEPVWAISHGGEGHPCSPEKAEQQQQFIRHEIAHYTDISVPLLYGGSVDPDNIVSYVRQTHIDGVLVGHASVDAEKWHAMVSAVTAS